jgi:hypothetical protein
MSTMPGKLDVTMDGGTGALRKRPASAYGDDINTVFFEDDDDVSKRIIEDASAKSARLTISITTVIVVVSIVFLVGGIILAAILHDNDSSYSTLKNVAEDAVVSVPLVFDSTQLWKVPSTVANGGRVLLTMSGGGGGGCDGGPVSIGGGGDSGVSTVQYPILVSAKDECLLSIGAGGQRNQDGQYTSVLCVSSDGTSTHVDLIADGGHSGCWFFNGTQMRRGPDDGFPYTQERVGGRPDTGYLAESHPYGGAPGVGAGAGAGSVFGNGGDSGNGVAVIGDNGHGKGSGGGGGGGGFGFGGAGAGGRVKLVYTVKIKN